MIMNNREEGREEVRRLIHSFQVNVAGYRRPGSLYYETSLRTDFLDPLLCALGWDVNNYKELPQDLREVVQETTIEVSENESSKKPDYAFRVGRQFRFFLEAKKPSVRVGEEKASAFQARRYGFSASHPICVLSNFDCTIIYRTIEPPDMDDDPRSGIIAKYSFKELITCFDDLYDSISREALYNGHFEKIFAADEQRLLYQQFDAYFLKQIELWRMVLASDISQRNMKIGANELNYFVQRILNRIIFLRICEDRNLERYESLKKLSMGGTYEDLKSLFRKAEKRYNSGLFNLIEDPTLDIQVGNEALIKVLVDLYYPKSPYTFAVVGANVLGAIYEQFISKRIEIGSKRTVDLKEKPEVREGGGVFLTPRYVVEALVQRTLDPLVARKTAQDVAKLRIADICCGSGTFLLGVFEYLQSWYLDWYLKDGSEKHSDRIYEVGGGNWRLMLQEKRRILLTNIFGVDIDEQAVEVTQFGLLLKIIEDENDESVKAHTVRLAEPALPSLENNIKCGNSLVDNRRFRKFSPEPTNILLEKVNPINWEIEFTSIMKAGGFDAIVGNPPYIRIQNMMKYAPEEVEFYQSGVSGYTCAERDNFDKYHLFVERALNLLKNKGRLGYIIPNKFLTLRSGRNIRRLLSKGRLLRELIHFGVLQIFSTSTTYTCLIFLEKDAGTTFFVEHVESAERWRYGVPGPRTARALETLTENPWVFVSPVWDALFKRLQAENPSTLEEIAEIFVGVQTSADDIYIIYSEHESQNTITFRDKKGRRWLIERSILRACLHNVPLEAFTPPEKNSYIIFPYLIKKNRAIPIDLKTMRREFPRALSYLKAHQRELKKRDLQDRDTTIWYQFGRTQSLTKF